MKTTLLNFLIGSGVTLASLNQLGVDENTIPPELIEAIKAFISVLGGLITAILLALLRKKFPEIFGKKKVK